MNEPLIRVWLKGPLRITDERGTRIEGESFDVEPGTSIATSVYAKDRAREPPPGCLSTVGLEQDMAERRGAWLLRDGLWVDALIEDRCTTLIRAAVLAEREECATLVLAFPLDNC